MKGKTGSGDGAAGAGKWGVDGDGPEAAELLFSAFPPSSDEDSEDERRSPAGRKRTGGISHTRKSGAAGAPPASTAAATSTAAAAGVQGGGGGGSGGGGSSSSSIVGGGASGSDGGGSRSGGGGSGGDGGDDKRSEASGRAERENEEEEEEDDDDDEGAAEGGGSAEDHKEENDSSSAMSGALAAGDTDLDDDPPVAGGAAAGAEEQQLVHDVEGAAAAAPEAPAAGDDNNAEVAANNHGESVDLTQSDEEEEEEEEEGRGPCPLCGKSFPLTKIDAHANACLDESIAVPPAEGPNAASGGGGSGGAGGGGSSSPASSAQGAAGIAGGDVEGKVEGKGTCLMCSKLFPFAELQAHTNQCLDADIQKDEEKKKKKERAERQEKSKRNRPVEGVLGDISGAESSGGGARSSRVKKEHGNLPAFDVASASDGGSSAHEDKPGRANSGGGKRKSRGGGGGAVGAGRGAGPAKQHRKAKAEDKKGKGKARDVPTGGGGGPGMFKCPKNVLRQRTGGCGAFNLESDQMCSECDHRLWESIELKGAPVRLRLGDGVTFKEPPHLGHRGEEIVQEGYIHSFELKVDALSSDEERRETKARCAYKKHRGYLSAGIALSDLTLVPQQPQHGSSEPGGAGNSSGANGAVGKEKQRKGSSFSAFAGKGSSSAGAAAISDQSVQSWGQGRCEHVAAGEECNHKNGKCLSCHKASKRAGGKSGSENDVDGGDDPMKPEVEETQKNGLDDSTTRCETAGCNNGHHQLGVCRSCFARHRERVAKIVTERKLQRKHLPPCRACEGRLSESSHAEGMRDANKAEGVSVDLDESTTGSCSLCGTMGGKGYGDQLLMCDGLGCSNACHMRCLEPKLTQVPRGLWFCDRCVKNKNKEKSEIGCTACHSPFEDEKLLYCDGPGIDGSGCEALYHLGCLPVPLGSQPDGDWFCPRCAHGGRSVSCSSSSRGGIAARDGGTSDSGTSDSDDGGGGGGGGGGGRSNARACGKARPSSSSSSSPPRGGGGEKRKRGGGSGDGAASRKRSFKDSRARGCNSRPKWTGSSASPEKEAPPPADQCANPNCGGRPPAAGRLAGIKRAPCAPFTVHGGYGDGDSAGGQGVEVLAPMGAEEMRWRCGSAQCNGDSSDSSNSNNSYHKRCLEARRVSVRASGNAAPRHTPKERHAPGGQETPSLLSSAPGIIGSGGENGPARRLHPKVEMMARGGGEGLGEVEVEALKGKDALSEMVVSSMDDVEVVRVVPAGAAREAVAGKEDAVWEVEYVCPACKGVVATQEEVDTAMQGVLRYRVFEATLSRCFWAEFGKPRSEVEDDRNLGIKGSKKTVAGKPDLMYGSIYEGVADFIFRMCGLNSEDCFVDIGSGLGQIVTQAAAWAGCKSLGVEISQDHHQAAVRLWNKLKHEAARTTLDNNALAAVSLIEGDFLDKWNQLKDCTVIYLNNAGGWFKSKHPNMACSSHESKLVELLQELDRSVTLVTIEQMHLLPQGWTHEERTYRTPNGDERLATFRKASMKIHFYKTNAGSWVCKHCTMCHEKAVRECSCDRPPDLRSTTTAGRGSNSTLP